MRNKENLKKWRTAYKEWLRPNIKDYKAQWYLKNKERLKNTFKSRYQTTKEAVRAANLKNYYGISLEQYAALFKQQQGCCAICSMSQEQLSTKLCVDHNHATGEIRGLLCSRCNFGLGSFKDNPDVMIKAAAYVSPLEVSL
jgi:hypothetical protein